MKKAILFSLVFSICGSCLIAQTAGGDLIDLYSVNQLAYLNPKSTGFPTFSNVDRTEGTPFLYDSWRTGQIQVRGGDKLSEPVGLVLDLDNHVLYVQLDDDKYGDLPIQKVQTLTLTEKNKTYWFEVHDLEREFGEGPAGLKYYEVLHHGEEYTVLHYHEKYLRKESHIENLGMVRRPDKYMSLHSYYLFDGKKLTKVKRTSKGVRNAVPKKAKTIKKLIDKHDLKMKEEDDFVKLFVLLEQQNS